MVSKKMYKWRLEMKKKNKKIEKCVLKIIQAMKKNRKMYEKVKKKYEETNYFRFYRKMERLDEEYEEFNVFLHLGDSELRKAERGI